MQRQAAGGAAAPDYPRRFLLRRDVDHTGVSGTGFVAEGVLWTDGTVTLRWLGKHSSHVVWRRLTDAEAIHGHDGATHIHWIDPGPMYGNLRRLTHRLVVEQAQHHDPDGDDVVERLSDLTGEPFDVCGQAITEAIEHGLLWYNHHTESAVDARPTNAGLALLNDNDGLAIDPSTKDGP